SSQPRYEPTPTNIAKAIAERRLQPEDLAYATALYQHIRRSQRYKDKGQRITAKELGVKVGKGERAAERAIARMIAATELVVVSPANGNRNGAIYRFPPRSA